MDIINMINTGAYHPLQEEIVNMLMARTDNDSSGYFRVVTAFHFAEIASGMRCMVKDKIFAPDPVPTNLYGCILMPSGAGKNFSNNILETKITHKFKNHFINNFLPTALESNIDKMAQQNSVILGQDLESCRQALYKESTQYGTLLYSFDSATTPAFKQARAKAQMCGAGSLNFVCDEIGTNLANCQEVVSVVLEMYDTGTCKSKLVKNTADNQRNAERFDSVPVNVLWFGTPASLLNSGKEEEDFIKLLEAGLARRMVMATGDKCHLAKETPEEYIAKKLQKLDDSECEKIADSLEELSGILYYQQVISTDDEGTNILAYYRQYCLERADALPEQQAIEKAELINRTLKILKLAGIYAFIDKADIVSKENIISAIKLIEDSGKTLANILHREEPFIKLAKFLGNNKEEFTKADLMQRLPYFKNAKSVSAQQEMIDRACEWGYKNSIIIKKYNRANVQFIMGETLEETNLNELIISVSNHEAYNYVSKPFKFSNLKRLGSSDGYHWVNHYLTPDEQKPELGNYRKEECIKPGFNMVVLDIDDGSIPWTQEVLKDYYYVIYTTKRHQVDGKSRFRVIIPIKYKLSLDKDEYKQFMLNIFDSLPFSNIDVATAQRSKKWLSHAGTVLENTQNCTLFDPRPYIPCTAQNQERIEKNKKYGNVDNIDRWFLQNTSTGNRNNMLFRYGKLLVDRGDLEPTVIEKKIKELNSKLDAPIAEDELKTTVLTSVFI